jgi:hypothetical protein
MVRSQLVGGGIYHVTIPARKIRTPTSRMFIPMVSRSLFARNTVMYCWFPEVVHGADELAMHW